MATKPMPVYLQDRNSGLVMEYQPDGPYQLVINNKQQGNLYQQFYITCSGVAGYVYVESVGKANTVVSGSQDNNPLYMSAMDTSRLNLNELWILDNGTNQYFVLMGAATGFVMDVVGKGTAPGTEIQTHDRNNGSNQQWAFLPAS